MRKWTKTAGFVVMAASAAAWPALHGGAVTAQTTSAGPRELAAGQDTSDPFAAPATPATTNEVTPATKPDSGGQSAVAPQIDVKNSGNFEIHVNNTPLAMVLRMLSGQSHRNIIASKEVHGTITADLYDVTLKEALDAILLSNDYAYVMKGDFIYVYTAKELQERQQRERVKKTEVFRLFYTPAADVMKLVMPVLSKDAVYAQTPAALMSLDDSSAGGSASGGGTSGGGSGGGSSGASGGGSSGGSGGNQHAGDDMIVITDYDDNLAKVRQLIQQVDRRPQQILIEATILSASLNEDNALGVNFTVLGGVNFSTLGAINGASSGGATGTAATGTTGTTGSTGTTPGVSPSAAVSSALTGTIIDNTAAGALLHSGYSAAQFGGSGLNVGLITNNVGMFLTALEGVTDTTVLANPKVLVLNKQQGMVHVGQNIGYSTAITTETTTTSTVSFLSTGVSLIFRPYIGDNGYIRLDIHPENSSGNLDSKGNPDQYTTEIATDVMVKDGRTIVIGGLFEDETTRTRSQVPFLGSLPVVGALFRQQADATQRQEIIILLTPHIVKDLDAYGDASDAESRYVDRLEVGARKGLMPWGRERLAESWYERAVDEMSKPHPNRQLALWNLNCAISLNPMFSEAMELRAQITGKEMTATDDSTIRSFVKDQIMAEQLAPTSQPAVAAALMLDGPPMSSAWRPWPEPMGATALGPNRDADRRKLTRSDTRPADPARDATATTYIPNEPIEAPPASSDEQK